jgi:hypothetical protein
MEDVLSVESPHHFANNRTASGFDPAPGNGDSTSANPRSRVPELKGFRRFSHKIRRATRDALQTRPDWEARGREPYHEYVHRLVEAGWDNLKGLDKYMCQNFEDKDLVISVLDITDDFAVRRWPDMHDEGALQNFLAEESRGGSRVRLFLAEQRTQTYQSLSSGVMEAFGSAMKLDPRFFQLNIDGNKRLLLPPSESHRTPFTSIGFTVRNESTTSNGTETQFFRISICIQPDDSGDGWTGSSSSHCVQEA